MDKSGNEPLDGDDDWWKPQQYGASNAINKILQAARSVSKQVNKINTQKVCSIGDTSELKNGSVKVTPKLSFNKKPAPYVYPCPPIILSGKDLKSLDIVSTVLKIDILYDELYEDYAAKFDDTSRLKEIEKQIDIARNKNLEDVDFAKAQEECNRLRRSMKLPPFTTNDGMTFINGTLISLENTIVSDVFIFDASNTGNVSFTLNVTQFSSEGFGVSSDLVKLNIAFPAFDKELININLGASIELTNISSQHTDGAVTIRYGFIIGFGLEGGFSFSPVNSILQFQIKGILIVGLYVQFELDFKKVEF